MMRKWLTVIVIGAMLWMGLGRWAAAANIVLDGQFGDWAGQPYIEDTVGDGQTRNADLVRFYWATNPGESTVYLMSERFDPSNPGSRVYFGVLFDTDNNGDFFGPDDRFVLVEYRPRQDYSEVNVTVLTGTGAFVSQYGGDWGDSRNEGGRRAEIGISFADLGIDAHQTIQMIVWCMPQNPDPYHADWAPDSGTITWSPVPVLGWPWLVLATGAALVVTWQRRGRFVWRSR